MPLYDVTLTYSRTFEVNALCEENAALAATSLLNSSFRYPETLYKGKVKVDKVKLSKRKGKNND